MLMPSDKDYRDTKQIMQKKAAMNPDFIDLASFIDEKFGVKTINIIYDTIDAEMRPRLNICFEFENEKQTFMDDGGTFVFDRRNKN